MNYSLNHFMKGLFEKFNPYTPLLLVAILYFYTAPFSVQGGDTGELVTNAYHLRVAHPPGYPLFTFLYHWPVRYIGFTNPFHIAALFTAVISLLSLSLLFKKFRSLESHLVIVLLASNLVVWRYAVLPDVFSLHTFFLVILFLVFYEPEKSFSKPGKILLSALSVTNHHTIVFIFPMFLYALLKSKRLKQGIVYSLMFGALALGSYLGLMLYHPEEYGSWGSLTSLKDVVDHFLRKEYGTFQLSAVGSAKGSWLQLFSTLMLSESWSLVVVSLYIVLSQRKVLKKMWQPLLLIAVCIALYAITFIFKGNISLDAMGSMIMERFTLQAILLSFSMLLFVLEKGNIQLPSWLKMIVLVNIGLNLVQNYSINNYRQNTHLEDFVKNAFDTLPKDSILYAYGDNFGHAAYYLHSVMNYRNDVVLLHPTSTFSWSISKAAQKYPDAVSIKSPRLLENLNLGKYSFYVTIPPQEVPEYHQANYWGILFQVKKSDEKRPRSEYICEHHYTWRNRLTEEQLLEYENGRLYDLQYGNCHFALSLEELNSNKISAAKENLRQAVKLAPNSAKIWERYCTTLKKLNDSDADKCEERFNHLIQISHPQYFLQKNSL